MSSQQNDAGPSLDSLPPPLQEIDNAHAPDFLKPEATKQVAKAIHRGSKPSTKKQAQHEEIQKEWDIADMAPQLKQQRDDPSKAQRNIISAAAKRSGSTYYKQSVLPILLCST